MSIQPSKGNVGLLGQGTIGGNSTAFGNVGLQLGLSFRYPLLIGFLAQTATASLTDSSVTASRTSTEMTPLASVWFGFRTNPITDTGTLDDIIISGDPVTVREAIDGHDCFIRRLGLSDL